MSATIPTRRRAELAPPPAWIKPQLAKLVEQAPYGLEWLHEIKFDGYRMHARLDRGRVQILTRRGNDWTDKYLWRPKIISWLAQLPRWATLIAGMIGLLKLLGGLLVGLLRSHAAREAEMAFLRQQLVVLKRSAPARLRLRTADRLIFVWLYRLFPSLLEAAVVFKPETLVRW